MQALVTRSRRNMSRLDPPPSRSDGGGGPCEAWWRGRNVAGRAEARPPPLKRVRIKRAIRRRITHLRVRLLVEQARHRFLQRRAVDRFAEQRGDGDDADVAARSCTAPVGSIVSVVTSSRQLGGGDARDGAARKDAVRDVGGDGESRPCSSSTSAALQSVPPESTMSSTMMQCRPVTSPMMFITSDSPGRSRRLSTMASCASMRLAMMRARTTPPTSGDTTIRWLVG